MSLLSSPCPFPAIHSVLPPLLAKSCLRQRIEGHAAQPLSESTHGQGFSFPSQNGPRASVSCAPDPARPARAFSAGPFGLYPLYLARIAPQLGAAQPPSTAAAPGAAQPTAKPGARTLRTGRAPAGRKPPALRECPPRAPRLAPCLPRFAGDFLWSRSAQRIPGTTALISRPVPCGIRRARA